MAADLQDLVLSKLGFKLSMTFWAYLFLGLW